MAGLVAGSMSMAVGEYVSVSSQRDSEKADIVRETRELESHPQAELDELAMVYAERGIEKELAMKVAQQLSERDRLGAHMRDELGVATRNSSRISAIAVVSLMSLAALGAFGGHSVARRSVVPRYGSPSEGVWRWR